MSSLYPQLSLKTRAMDVVMGVQAMYETILHNWKLPEGLFDEISQALQQTK